ncbi:MAG: energy-coupling factor ABC transporter permease, partial [Desulfuromonadales bacterium]
MADALLSPAVGGTFWAASAAVIAYSSKKIRHDLDDRKIPLMGVIGAFVFAAQMINFTIPGTGSSGHIGGGLLLAVLLGPHAALLTIASVLTVQALFFADGGLLALGSNIFNLGILPCFLAYPLIYRPLAGGDISPARITNASLFAAVVGLQLGALGVVTQTTLSGISELPFSTFALLMQPIHLAIGIVEGLVTAAVLAFLLRAQPEILAAAPDTGRSSAIPSLKKVMVALLVATALTGGVLSWFASERPDG